MRLLVFIHFFLAARINHSFYFTAPLTNYVKIKPFSLSSFSTKIKVQSRKERYIEEEEEEFEEEDDAFYPFPNKKQMQTDYAFSNIYEKQPTNVKFKEFEDERIKINYEYDYDEDVDEEDYYYEEDDDYEFEEGEQNETGNYWYNPQRGYDTKQKIISTSSSSSAPIYRTTKRRTKEPNLILDFYNKFFWYGIDMNDEEEQAGRVIFGGTKGKFNGLDLVNSISDDNSIMNKRGIDRRRKRERRGRNNDFDPFRKIENEVSFSTQKSQDRSRYTPEEDDDYEEEYFVTSPQQNSKNRRKKTQRQRQNPLTLSIIPYNNEASKTFQQYQKKQEQLNQEIDTWFTSSNNSPSQNNDDMKESMEDFLDALSFTNSKQRKAMEDVYNQNLKLGKYKDNQKRSNLKRNEESIQKPYREDKDEDESIIVDVQSIQHDNEAEIIDLDGESTADKVKDTIDYNNQEQKEKKLQKDATSSNQNQLFEQGAKITKKEQQKQQIKNKITKLQQKYETQTNSLQAIQYQMQDIHEELFVLKSDVEFLKDKISELAQVNQRITIKLKRQIRSLQNNMEEGGRTIRLLKQQEQKKKENINNTEEQLNDLRMFMRDFYQEQGH